MVRQQRDDPRAQAAPPRVIFVLDDLGLRTGGLTKAWLRRIRLFSGAGWDVHIALITPDRQLDSTLTTLRADGRLPRSAVVHRYWRDRGWLVDAASRRLRSIPEVHVPGWLDRLALRQGALVFADAISTYEHLANMRNPRVAKVFAIHLAHLSNAAHALPTQVESANGPLSQRFAALPEGTMRQADRIVVLTHAQKADFLVRWGADLPVSVIPHCADPIPPQTGAGYDPKLVVVIGRLIHSKRYDDAIRAMARVIRQVPDARLVIHGEGEDRDRLQGAVDGLGLRRSVSFAGYTTSALDVMASAACVIATTRREAMPLTLLESLSVGTPVVAYDVRYGPREIVRDGVDGFIVPARDFRAAAAAVVRLLVEPGLRARMSESARTVSARFSPQEHDRAWLELGREVYQNRG